MRFLNEPPFPIVIKWNCLLFPCRKKLSQSSTFCQTTVHPTPSKFQYYPRQRFCSKECESLPSYWWVIFTSLHYNAVKRYQRYGITARKFKIYVNYSVKWRTWHLIGFLAQNNFNWPFPVNCYFSYFLPCYHSFILFFSCKVSAARKRKNCFRFPTELESLTNFTHRVSKFSWRINSDFELFGYFSITIMFHWFYDMMFSVADPDLKQSGGRGVGLVVLLQSCQLFLFAFVISSHFTQNIRPSP